MIIAAVDDETPALSNLTDALKKVRPEAEILGFSDPDDLIEYAKNNHLDIACLDIQMYEMTGIEVAEILKSINPRINIIFVTAFNDYVSEAMELHASGYLRKPVSVKALEKELNDLRYEVSSGEEKLLRAKCFGNFELFNKNGEIVHFSRSKSKEAFAYLILLNGSSCTIGELCGVLFEDEEYDSGKKNYLQKIISELMKDLEKAGAERVIRKSYNSMAVDPGLIECDYYSYLQDGKKEKNLEMNFFNQYTWAEYYKDI